VGGGGKGGEDQLRMKGGHTSLGARTEQQRVTYLGASASSKKRAISIKN